MSLLSFIKDAGEKLFRQPEAAPAQTTAAAPQPTSEPQQASAPQPDVAALNAKAFEANRPMLTDPDRVYPGQKLRIPALA